MLELLANGSTIVLNYCQAIMQDTSLNDEIKRIGFDLALVNGFLISYCGFLLPYVHEIPYVFLFSQVRPWVAGIPDLPSFSPNIEGTKYLSDKMTFLERLQNLAAYNFSPLMILGKFGTSLLHEYAPDIPNWNVLAGKSLLFIETRDIVLERPSASMPNLIRTPGITVSPPKPLPRDLEAIMKGMFIRHSNLFIRECMIM